MAFTERISTGATFSWNAATPGRLEAFGLSGTAPALDITGQDSGGQRDYIAGIRKVSYSPTLFWDALDTTCIAFHDDFMAGTTRAAILTTPEGVAFAFDGMIAEKSEAANLGDVIKVSARIEVRDGSDIDPTSGL